MPNCNTLLSCVNVIHWATGTLQCLQKDMATYRHWSVSLRRDPDNVSHCRILSPDKTEWWLISARLCGWRRCFVAHQLWLMTRIWEEDWAQSSPASSIIGSWQISNLSLIIIMYIDNVHSADSDCASNIVKSTVCTLYIIYISSIAVDVSFVPGLLLDTGQLLECQPVSALQSYGNCWTL